MKFVFYRFYPKTLNFFTLGRYERKLYPISVRNESVRKKKKIKKAIFKIQEEENYENSSALLKMKYKYIRLWKKNVMKSSKRISSPKVHTSSKY